jgi:hypothetical protein
MLLRRVTQHVKSQDWTAIVIDFLIVVVGVYIGVQVANWNEARLDAERKEQIIEALITDISDSIDVQKQFVEEIDSGLSEWERSYVQGEMPAPYYFRTGGSDIAPDSWSMLQQMQLVDLFDPTTLFDLSFYFSELNGVGRKYVRYVTFVEDNILPYAETNTEIFYENGKSDLKPIYRGNMDRLQEFRDESKRLTKWAECLVFRLQSETTFDTTCVHAKFVLDGMGNK